MKVVMNGVPHITKETCRTCLSYFDKENSRFSLLNCLAITENSSRFEIMKKVMTTCSLTLLSVSAKQEMAEIFICMTCMIEINQMLNFLEKCIRSEEILKQAAEVKEEHSFAYPSDRPKTETGFNLNVEAKNEEANKNSATSNPAPPMLRKNEEMKYECQNCHKMYPSALSLAFHKYKHSGYKPYACMVCEESFRTVQLIKEHMVVAHNNMQYQAYLCRQCPDAFTTKENLTRHEQRVHNAKKYSCSACKRSFSTVSSLKYHENIHLGIRSKSFSSVSLWKNHKSKAHGEVKQFQCHCGRSFNRKKKLELHVESAHEKKDKLRKYQCPECDKKFHHPYSLKNHLNTHLGIKPFLCNACGAAFTALSNLTSHFRRKHSGDKQPAIKKYLCHTCGDSFARASHLQRHTLRKHVPNVEKKHECPICQKKFLEKSDLTGHVKLHDDVKPFACDQCSKSFRTGWRLQAHVKRVHLGLRPFECPTCSVKFKTKSHLEKHIRTHTGEKPFPCPHCAYSCAEKSNLKKHINIHLKSS